MRKTVMLNALSVNNSLDQACKERYGKKIASESNYMNPDAVMPNVFWNPYSKQFRFFYAPGQYCG